MQANLSVPANRRVNNVVNKNAKSQSALPNMQTTKTKVAADHVSAAKTHTQDIVAVGNKPAKPLMDNYEAPFVSADDLEEGEFSAPEYHDFEILISAPLDNFQQQLNEDNARAQSPHNIDNLNLTLQNSFELLESDSERVTREAKPNDEESAPITMDMQIDKNPIMGVNSLGKENLTQSTNLEDPGKLRKRTLKYVASSLSNPLLDSTNGRRSLPIIDPYPLD